MAHKFRLDYDESFDQPHRYLSLVEYKLTQSNLDVWNIVRLPLAGFLDDEGVSEISKHFRSISEFRKQDYYSFGKLNNCY